MEPSWWSTRPFYTLVIVIIACGSIPKGYDEGGFSASVKLDSFKADFNLVAANWTHDETGLANRTANITSFNVLGAAFGALLALDLNDRLGRLSSWRVACLVWASGLFIQIFSSGIYGLLLFSRIWAGLGAGSLTVVTPLYLSEIAPAKTRGLVVSVYMVVLLTMLTLGFFINYAASVHMASTRTQYRLVQAIPLIPVGLAFCGSYVAPETPRYLVSQQRHAEGRETLARLRGRAASDAAVAAEFATIDAQVRARATDLASVSHWTAFKETQTNANYRQRFWLLMAMQTVAQWTGGNGITYYVASIFEYAGLSGTRESLVSSGAYGVVKLVFTMAFTWGLIDVVGRRRCALLGLALQLAAHVYMGAYMGLRPGSSANAAASDAAIASVFVYAVGWSVGLCTIPYLYGAEIFPTRVRNVGYAVSMSLHWFFQFAIVRVTPNMFVSLHVWGAYLFWSIVCLLGLVVLGVWMPETKGVPMEYMGELFEGPWYLRWRATVSTATEEEEQDLAVPVPGGRDVKRTGV
ncbi:general substrate transporter [Aspergillus ambiguus]|uniref:putative MFS quinate transporter n=1 Tax=Aspergillus ambiguus TaxID=176160 RepID=UPI003CCD0CF9